MNSGETFDGGALGSQTTDDGEAQPSSEGSPEPHLSGLLMCLQRLARLQQTPVDISLDAFDSTIYGKLTGNLIYLSSDTLTEQGVDGNTTTYYRARVRVDREAKAADPKFADLELRPGMTATVDIRTAKRTVLQFIAKPILRAFSGALTQR